MKQSIFAIFAAAALLLGMSACTARDDNPITSGGTGNSEGAYLKEFNWDVDFPYDVYMSPGVAAELKEAYGDFIDDPATEITDKTYMVILDKLSDLPEEKLVELYEKDVVIAVAHPKKADFDALYKDYPELGYYYDSDDIDKALLFAICKSNNGIYLIPDVDKYADHFSVVSDHSEGPNPKDAEAGEYDPNEPIQYATNDDYDIYYYYFGMFLEELLSQQAATEAASRPAFTRSEEKGTSIKDVGEKIHLWSPGAVKIDELYFRTSYRFAASALVSVSYDIYPIHVYEGELGAGDYYFMDMTANINNESMYKGKTSFTTSFFWVKLRWCGAYAKNFKVSSTLINGGDDNQVEGVSFPAKGFPIPSTVTKTVDHSETSSFNIGCGLSGKGGYSSGSESDGTTTSSKSGWDVGGAANVNAGWSWSDTKRWTVKDVDVENKTGDATASWSLVYNNLPYFDWSQDCGFNEGESRAYRSATQIRGSWIWYIPNVPDESETKPRRIKVETVADYGFMRFWGTKADLETFNWQATFSDIKTMPSIPNFKAGKLILVNDSEKYISNIMVYRKGGTALVPSTRFQNSYKAGQEVQLGGFKCSEDIIVKFKMDGKTYVYKTNEYVKTVFKDEVKLYVTNDFKVEE